MPPPPPVGLSREQLLHLLAEASEFEHNLLCCYLYAAFSIKNSDAPEFDAIEREALDRWRQTITGVAIEEMTHLALVANLSVALGARPHFDRPNFPVAKGYHPAGLVVELAPFDAATLDHFVFLERPQDAALPDGKGFTATDAPARGTRPGIGLMPSALDYATTAEFYRRIRDALVDLARQVGEDRLFVGDPQHQVGADLLRLDGLHEVTDLASALAALETIVVQGEGAPQQHERSHFNQFTGIRDEYQRLSTRRRGFEPAHPVARNPVMREPIAPGRVHIDDPSAAAVLDVANALYNAMLRMLTQAWGRGDNGRRIRKPMLDAAIGLMHVCAAVARHLATLPAGDAHPGVNAGMSFTMLRATSPWIESPSEATLLLERLGELRDGLESVAAGCGPLQESIGPMTSLVNAFAAEAGLAAPEPRRTPSRSFVAKSWA
jgi:hypothetical protein